MNPLLLEDTCLVIFNFINKYNQINLIITFSINPPNPLDFNVVVTGQRLKLDLFIYKNK